MPTLTAYNVCIHICKRNLAKPKTRCSVVVWTVHCASSVGWKVGSIALHKQKAFFDYNTFIVDFIGIHFSIRSSNIFQAELDFFPPTNSVMYRNEVCTLLSKFNVN
jgi:hypothetical protein